MALIELETSQQGEVVVKEAPRQYLTGKHFTFGVAEFGGSTPGKAANKNQIVGGWPTFLIPSPPPIACQQSIPYI